MDFLAHKRILITGGTGTFGQECVRQLLAAYPRPERIMVLSRDELKQSEMQSRWPDTQDRHSRMRYFIGDVRDKQKLLTAFKGVDYIIHAAALKRIDSCEYNPSEAVNTNVIGAQNVIEAAAERGVEKVIALSSDKAVAPVNLYGATKLVAERLFVAANTLGPRFSVVRYGNVLGSRGSVVPVFREQMKEGVIRITDARMTRFWITIEQAVWFVLGCLSRMEGGEVFVPLMGSSPLIKLAGVLDSEGACEVREVGVRPGEKLHEVLVTKEEADRTYLVGDSYVVLPSIRFFGARKWQFVESGATIGQVYSSETNPIQFTEEQLRGMV